jgi:hypothetical protein
MLPLLSELNLRRHTEYPQNNTCDITMLYSTAIHYVWGQNLNLLKIYFFFAATILFVPWRRYSGGDLENRYHWVGDQFFVIDNIQRIKLTKLVHPVVFLTLDRC